MSYKDIAYKILTNNKRNMSIREIFDSALKKKFITNNSPKIKASMATALYRDIARGKLSLFVLVARGQFGLRKWYFDTDQELTNDTSTGDGYIKKVNTQLFAWHSTDKSVVASFREYDPYHHHCPIDHFTTICKKIKNILSEDDNVNISSLRKKLDGEYLSKNHIFKGKSELYKLNMAFTILEYEGLLVRDSKGFYINKNPAKISTWLRNNL